MIHEKKEDSVTTVPMTQFELKDAFVAPWGLAKEERPVHYIWEGDVEKIQLKISADIVITDLFNTKNQVESYIEHIEDEEEEYTLVNVPSEDFVCSGYFGATVTTRELHEEPLVGHVVEANFFTDDEVVTNDNITFTTRPIIRIRDIPQCIKLKDEKVEIVHSDAEENKQMDYPGTIEADMEQIGFSLAQVETHAWGEGVLSHEESVYQDLAEALNNVVTGDETNLMEVPEETREDVPLEIPDETVENTVEDFREWLSNESLVEELDNEEITRISEILREESSEFDMSEVYKHFEYLLMNSIIDVVERHPADNVQMKSPNTTIEIESRLNSFNIGFELSDKVGNEYESEVIEIQVEDQRDSGGIAELELTTNWNEMQIDPSKLDELREEVRSEI